MRYIVTARDEDGSWYLEVSLDQNDCPIYFWTQEKYEATRFQTAQMAEAAKQASKAFQSTPFHLKSVMEVPV